MPYPLNKNKIYCIVYLYIYVDDAPDLEVVQCYLDQQTAEKQRQMLENELHENNPNRRGYVGTYFIKESVI